MYTPEEQRKNKPLEPFKLYGLEADILSLETARTVVKENLYYLYFYTILSLSIGAYLFYYSVDSGPYYWGGYVIQGSFTLFMCLLLRFFMSRAAAILILSLVIAQAILTASSDDSGGMFIILYVIVLLASFRCIKATFSYHKLRKI